jgi:uncharacterized phage protein (TIGR01671 family)
MEVLMSQNLFKAKWIKGEKPWIDGFYLSRKETTYCFTEDYEKYPVKTLHFIAQECMTDWGLPNDFRFYEVDENTLCKNSELQDRNGKDIFEHDIIKIHNAESYFNGKIFEGSEYFGVIYYAGTFSIRDTLEEYECNTFKNNSWTLSSIYQHDIEVVGNIFDNPELLKKETDNE